MLTQGRNLLVAAKGQEKLREWLGAVCVGEIETRVGSGAGAPEGKRGYVSRLL